MSEDNLTLVVVGQLPCFATGMQCELVCVFCASMYSMWTSHNKIFNPLSSLIAIPSPVPNTLYARGWSAL